MAEYYVATTGDDSTGDGSEGNPWATPGFAAAQIAADDIVWVKDGTYTITTSTPGAAGPVVLPAGVRCKMEGYLTTAGDRGAIPVVSAGAVGSINIFKLDGTFNSTHLISHMEADGNSQSSVKGFLGTDYDTTYKCVSRNCTTGYDTCRSTACRAFDCTTGFANPRNSDLCWASGCTTGFNVTDNGVSAINCIASGGATGFDSIFQSRFVGCFAYGQSGDGFSVSGSHSVDFVNCLAVSCGGYGFNTRAGEILIGCAGFNNTSGNVNLTPLANYDFQTLTADPFVDAVNDDFNINNDAGGGAVLRGVEVTL